MLGNFSCFCCRLLTFFKIYQNLIFQKKIFQEHYQCDRCVDPDQDQHFVWPDLGPYFLQRLAADNKSPLARKELRGIQVKEMYKI